MFTEVRRIDYVKILPEERVCALSGRVYLSITYLAERGETLEEISAAITAAYDDKTDRELVKEEFNGQMLSGFKVRLVKAKSVPKETKKKKGIVAKS